MSRSTVAPGTRTRWRNWAGNQQATAEALHPASTDEVAAVLAGASAAGRRVRPIGSGHSFTAVGRPDDLKGEAICCFVTLKGGNAASDALKDELKKHVAKEIGALARPDDIRFTDALPKTRSGKIMRRLLRDIAAGREGAGDTTTLEDYTVLAKLREEDE